MKKYTFLLLLIISLQGLAQSFEDQWKGFFSFVSVIDISQGNDLIYVASENAIFTFDINRTEINTLTTINGLSGESISQIHYSDEYGALFIGYENGLMEVVIDGEEDVLKVVDILEKPTIPPDRKRINHFHEEEGFLYISTLYGISVYDISNLEFGDSYFIGDFGTQIEVRQTTILPPYIYAATREEGIKRALIASEDLINYEEWTSIVDGGIVGIQRLGDEVYFARNNNRVLRLVPEPFQVVADFGMDKIVDFTTEQGVLTVTTENKSTAYGPNFTQLGTINGLSGIDDQFQAGLAAANNLYVGTTENGLFQIPFGSTSYEQILPDGPILNNPFAIDASPGQLWVGFGDITVSFNPFPLSYRGISNLKDEQWTNIQEDQIFGASDIVYVRINPMNSNEAYFSSFQQGLLKVVEQVPQILYNEENSPLEPPPSNLAAGLRIYGSAFDRDNNLWFTQTKINEGLVRLSPTGQFTRIDISDIINAEDELALNELAISREGNVFFGSAESGLIGFNPSTNTFGRITEGAGNGNLPSTDIRALEFDNSNRLWIGTREGLRVLFNVAGFFQNGNNTEAQAIIILDDGVPQELLFQQSITDIEVDGSNNKWISTASSGVFYLSSNGQETLLRFNKDNSPLPSNNVQDIAIDDSTGRVYFATTKGLVAYEGTSTAPRDNLEGVYAYPNPVRPGFSGNVTIDGLTSGANVKITDIEGNLVFETTSEGGSVLWDTKAFGRYKVASGVYLVLITSEDAFETKVTKIMVIR